MALSQTLPRFLWMLGRCFYLDVPVRLVMNSCSCFKALNKDVHRMALEIAPEMILDLVDVGDGVIKDGRLIQFADESGIPEGTRVIRAAINDQGNVVLTLENEAFPGTHPSYAVCKMDLRYRASSIKEKSDE